MLYRNKNWLSDNYSIEGLSTRQMAKVAGCDAETIRHWLIRYGIDRRPATNINIVEFTPELTEFIDGHLLGDMSVIQERQQSAFISFNLKHRGYCEWLSSFLLRCGVGERGQIKDYENEFGISWLYHSKYYRNLPSIRERWYHEGKKIVPADIELTPIVVRHWFIDDGSFFKAKGNIIGRVVFATNSFQKSEVEFLAEKLKIAIDKNTICTPRARVGWTLQFSNRDTVQAFFDYIGDCPPELEHIYGYKWPKFIQISQENGNKGAMN